MSSFAEESGSFKRYQEDIPSDLLSVLDEEHHHGLRRLMTYLLQCMRDIGDHLRSGHFSHDVAGTQNAFGDHQLDVDMKADDLIFDYLRRSSVVEVASSEENPVEVECGGEGYSVAFDPLDGSSIVDANFAVGTILGVWPGRGFLNRHGKEQIAGIVVMYGPRVTLAIGLSSSITKSGESIAMELTRTDSHWVVSIPRINIAPTHKTFAPGNLRATSDNAKYRDLVNYWIDERYTLRYSGGLVPDVYHIFVKGGGVLSNASSTKAKAKLRLLYECFPIALIVEAAGGASCGCPSEAGEAMNPGSVLELQLTDLDRRIGVCYGSKQEVERFITYLFDN